VNGVSRWRSAAWRKEKGMITSGVDLDGTQGV
jgi:hypothetical protein